MVPNAITAGQLAPPERKALVHALPNGPSAALAGATANVLPSVEGLDAIAATGTTTVAPLTPGVVVQLLVPLGLHGAAVGLGQPRLVMEVAPHAVPVPKEGQASVPTVGQEGPALGPLAVPMGAIPP